MDLDIDLDNDIYENIQRDLYADADSLTITDITGFFICILIPLYNLVIC